MYSEHSSFKTWKVWISNSSDQLIKESLKYDMVNGLLVNVTQTIVRSEGNHDLSDTRVVFSYIFLWVTILEHEPLNSQSTANNSLVSNKCFPVSRCQIFPQEIDPTSVSALNLHRSKPETNSNFKYYSHSIHAWNIQVTTQYKKKTFVKCQVSYVVHWTMQIHFVHCCSQINCIDKCYLEN